MDFRVCCLGFGGQQPNEIFDEKGQGRKAQGAVT